MINLQEKFSRRKLELDNKCHYTRITMVLSFVDRDISIEWEEKKGIIFHL